MQAGQIKQALVELRVACRAHPLHAGLAHTLADGLHAAGDLAGAVSAYHDALRLDDQAMEGWYGLGCAELAQAALGAAAASLRRAVALAPRHAPAHYNLAKTLFELGQVDASVRHFTCAARHGDAGLAHMAAGSIACIVPGSPAADNAAVLRLRRRWAADETRLNGIASPCQSRAPRPGGRVDVGYVSAFFGARNWMKPVFALINRHDRDLFGLHLFSDGTPPSDLSGYRDHPADTIHDITGVPNDRAADIVRQAGIDILVDLNGYSVPGRLGLLMRRPAPHQVGWFNMFATTGIAAYDWLVGDAATILPREARHYTERLHCVRGTYLAFEVLYPVPPVALPPCLATGAITFGCLGSHYKLTDQVLHAWGAILRGAPASRLFVKNGTLDDVSVRADLTGRLVQRGIEATRITLQGRSEHFEFLEAYRHVDIALDSFPYNGGTTTTEALWQGVPVLAFTGDRWAARTSASLLLAAGLPEWVMPDMAGYVAKAIAWATNPHTPALLAALRHRMRARLATSPACDANGLCADMEAFYHTLVAPAAAATPA